jgi:hypothetical protein
MPISYSLTSVIAETPNCATAGRSQETWSPSKPSCIVQGEVYITEVNVVLALSAQSAEEIA